MSSNKEGRYVAGIVVEPIQGEGGEYVRSITTPPPNATSYGSTINNLQWGGASSDEKF